MILTEPYYTVDGVSRTIELYQKSLDPTGLAIAQYGSKTLGAALGFGVPITETRHDQLRRPLRAHRPHAVRRHAARLRRFRQPVRRVVERVHPDGRLVARHARRHPLSDPGPAAERVAGNRPAVRRPCVLQDPVRAFGLLAALRRLRADVRVRIWAGAMATRASRCRSSRRSSRAASTRCAATRRHRSGRTTRSAMRSAAGARSSATWSSFYPILKGDKAVRASVFADAGQIWANGSQPQFESFRYSARRGRRMELADRSAEVQLRYSAQRPRRGSRAAVPVPGRHCVLMTTRTPALDALSPAGAEARRARALVAGAVAGIATSAAAVDYKIGFVNTERLFREAAPAKRAQAEDRKGIRDARRRDPEAREAGARPAGVARQGRRDDGGDRAAQQGARSRQPVARPAAHAARVPRGPQPAPQRGARAASRSARTR